MDFSLDGEIGIAKFDFVTVALRDIAIGLGFTSNITANSSTKMINMTGEKYTPFESLIMNAIGTNPSLAYSIATSGSVDVELRDWGGIPVDTLSIYAPTTWVQGKSLRYFIPDENPITRLLTHDFGTGYVMRDLSGMPAIDLSVLCIPAECDNIKLPIEYEIASRWDAYLLCDICRHFASVMLHFASLISHNLRCIPAYTHLIPTGFFQSFTKWLQGTTCISIPLIIYPSFYILISYMTDFQVQIYAKSRKQEIFKHVFARKQDF